MKRSALIVYQHRQVPSLRGRITLAEFKKLLTSNLVIRSIGKYSRTGFVTEDLEDQSRLFHLALALRLLSRGRCWVEDRRGGFAITWWWLAKRAAVYLALRCGTPICTWRTRRTLKWLRALPISRPVWNAEARKVCYIRSDTWHGLMVGGSVAHISGVLNAMCAQLLEPMLFSCVNIPLLKSGVQVSLVRLPAAVYLDHFELSDLAFNKPICSDVGSWVEANDVAFIYQRNSLHNFSGALVARNKRLPLVLEYNGSEVWIRQHWGTGLRFPNLANEIETLNLYCADLVVCVSKVDAIQLVERGVDPDKILVNPNGVDTDSFHPAQKANGLKKELDLEDRFVFVFSGTFGLWHGVPTLVNAYFDLVEMLGSEDKTAIVLVGDGAMFEEVSNIVETRSRQQPTARIVLIGSVDPLEMPKHLALADVLVAPHIANPDKTPFFGSPIKIFEYMAMGKPIIASSLGQIADVLVHKETALLVDPGDGPGLTTAMNFAMENPHVMSRLGSNARMKAEDKHTWNAHTRRILKALGARFA